MNEVERVARAASWVTLARPFARRRAIYRKKHMALRAREFAYSGDDIEQRMYLEGQADAAQYAAEAIEWMWADLRAALAAHRAMKEIEHDRDE